MKFIKAQALGNDFIIVEENQVQKGSVRAGLAVAICDRRFGIGADGLIFLESRSESRFSMKLLNSDGSPAEISGNGLRCLGACLQYTGRVGKESFAVETDAGTRPVEILEHAGRRFLIRSDLGAPRLASGDVPFHMEPPSESVVDVPLLVEERTFLITTLNMGNPQCIIFTDRLDMNEVRTYGPLIESHPRFPRKTNVEFVEVVSRKRIKIGIWERGAGETAASGTGSAASVVAARLNGKTDEKVLVECPGGDLEVEYPKDGVVTVTGEAYVVALGEYIEE
jgi:diaminopimelate epimerase